MSEIDEALKDRIRYLYKATSFVVRSLKCTRARARQLTDDCSQGREVPQGKGASMKTDAALGHDYVVYMPPEEEIERVRGAINASWRPAEQWLRYRMARTLGSVDEYDDGYTFVSESATPSGVNLLDPCRRPKPAKLRGRQRNATGHRRKPSATRRRRSGAG